MAIDAFGQSAHAQPTDGFPLARAAVLNFPLNFDRYDTKRVQEHPKNTGRMPANPNDRRARKNKNRPQWG
jgi:hypothetical protein